MGQLTQSVADAVASPRTAAIASGSTVTAGLGDLFNVVPWGSVAACIGAVLSFILIFVQVWRFILDRRRLLLQIKLFEAEAAAKGLVS